MKVLFTILYFYCFSKILAWFVHQLSLPLSAAVDVLSIVALFILFVLSLLLAAFTAEKIKDYYKTH